MTKFVTSDASRPCTQRLAGYGQIRAARLGNTRTTLDITDWCMEPTDVVLSKRGAGRDKDLEFARSAAQLALVTEDGLLCRLPLVSCAEQDIELMTGRIRSIFQA